MTLDVAESLLSVGALDQDDLARRFATSYHWSRGYGPGTVRVLKRIRRGEPWGISARAVHKEGSFGNGAAMRSSVLSLFFTHSVPELVRETRKAAEITHCHPLGIEGAVLIAVATQALLNRSTVQEALTSAARHCSSKEFGVRLSLAKVWLDANELLAPALVAKHLGNGISAQASCVSALYIALRHLDKSFNELMDFVIACKGDVDTIGAISGTLWGAYNGATTLPRLPIERIHEIESTAARLYERRRAA